MSEKDLIIIDLAHHERDDCIEDIADKAYEAGTLLWSVKILALEFADLLRLAGMALLKLIPTTAFIAALAP